MKRIIIIFQVLATLYISITFANNISIKSNEILMAKEYTDDKTFSLMKIPNNYFYKLDVNSRYYVLDKNDILDIYQYDYGGIVIYYNTNVLDLRYEYTDTFCSSKDTNVYIIKNENHFYLFFDKMSGDNDYRCYQFYYLTNNGIKLIETGNGKVDFVGYDYIVGYTSLGIIGYQISEFKKVFKNNKLELDGEYRVVGSYDGYPTFPIWKLYKLVKDLEYDEYDSNNKKYNKKTLKIGTKIRALSTDAQTYILIETEKGDIGKIKIDKVDCDNRDFYVNDKVFMNYYFLDGSKDSIEVFCPMFSY